MSASLHRADGILPYIAAAALTKGQLVKLDNNKQVIVCTGSDFPFGVAMEDAAVGDLASIGIPGALAGTVLMIALDNAIDVGDALITAAAGKVDGGATGKVVAVALEKASYAGQLIECAFRPPFFTAS